MFYRHTQIGWIMLILTFGIMPILFLALEGAAAISLPFVLAVIIALLFGTLTVTVDHKRISWQFGIGLIRKSLPVNAVTSFRAVRNRWWYGWGIRRTPFGWLYNVSGLDAVALSLDDGRQVLIGTDEPDALQHALRQVTALSSQPRETVLGKPPSRSTAMLVLLGLNAVVLPAALLAFVYVSAQQPAVTFSPAGFSVGGLYGTDVPFTAIQELSLQDSIPRVVRKNWGYYAAGTLRGTFTLEVLGTGKVYLQRDAPPFIVVKTTGSYVIINYKDPQQTRHLYEALRQHFVERRS